MKETTKDRVYKYLIEHPESKYRRLSREFPNVGLTTIKTYYRDWQKVVKYVVWLYKLLSEKYMLVKKLTLKDVSNMRHVERMIGVREWEDVDEDE